MRFEEDATIRTRSGREMEERLRQRDECGCQSGEGCRRHEQRQREVNETSLAANRFTAPQGAPIPNGYPSISDLVIADLKARKAAGLRKYGTTLQGMNGRDALIDAYQEALDLTQYLRQELFERYGE